MRLLGENHPTHVLVQYSQYGLDAAKAAFLSIFTDKMYILSFAWHDFKRANWAEELRSDPDVQAVLAERELKIAVLREQLRELMQEPEWQAQ